MLNVSLSSLSSLVLVLVLVLVAVGLGSTVKSSSVGTVASDPTLGEICSCFYFSSVLTFVPWLFFIFCSNGCRQHLGDLQFPSRIVTGRKFGVETCDMWRFQDI